VGSVNTQGVQHGQDIANHEPVILGRSFVRLVAVAMPASIEKDNPEFVLKLVHVSKAAPKGRAPC
jgi:hypothetical protein